ncbi:MAG: hypothetical protein J6X02_03355 [Bacilli bacterium]|nr:hypothetical protein [Bacilli bacterium]
MKDERAKYLIINAFDITKQLYQGERVACCNDFYNIYHRAGTIDANEIFAKNNVPEEFRKIIVKISAPVFSKKEAEEYTMGFPFDFKTKTIKKMNNRMYIRMNNIPIYYDESLFDDKFVIKTEEYYTSFNNVVYFLEECHKKGCIENYFRAIKEFFDISLDYGLLFDAWHETHNKNEALKIYKYKMISKRI